jgi:hypothetical protein
MEVEKIEKKTAAISLIMLTVLAATVGAITMTAFAATDTESNTDTAVTADLNQNVDSLQFGANLMMEQGFNGFGGGPRGHRGFMIGGMRNIEVSEEYTAAVNAILGKDSDVQNLVSQSYNVTTIKPIIKTVIGADGTVTTKATTAVVFMQGTSGFATIKVDVTNQAVTEIVTITRTVIDKTSS